MSLDDYACTCQVMETDHRLVRHDMRESMNHGTDHAHAGIFSCVYAAEQWASRKAEVTELE